MKDFIHRASFRIKAAATVLLPALLVGSCDKAFNEREGICETSYSVRFTDSYNLKYADAFASEVKSVSLYLFTPEGRFVRSWSDSGPALGKDGYLMKLDGAEPGRYRAVVWGGLAGHRSFSVPEMKPGESSISELTCRMARRDSSKTGWGTVSENLNSPSALFHGIRDINIPDDYRDNKDTIALVKNTNTIRIVLQELNPAEDSPEIKYKVSITDVNGLMAHDNAVMADDSLAYNPWATQSGTAALINGEKGRTFVSEMTIGRIMAEGHRPVLTVTTPAEDAKGGTKTVLSIPLKDYLLLVKGMEDKRKRMPDQEYLDRQDEWNLTFFVNGGRWQKVQILINGWVLKVQEDVL